MYSGKRFLITQPMIYGYNGSTMVTVELTRYLIDEGADVTIYTYAYDYPIKAELDNIDSFKVVVASDDESLSLNDFDYIWIHSQVLPASIVDEMTHELPRHMPKFIFLHMSPFDWIPDERPYIYEMEEKLSSKTLVISEEVETVIKKYLRNTMEGIGYGYFRNPAPMNFVNSRYKPSSQLKNILVVSNHPPGEINDAINLMKEMGLNVALFGEMGDEYKSITPETLSQYDVVITIGKTVQYCLVMGVPVYIYDKFGGCGYLKNQNFRRAEKLNFSGRGFEKKDSNSIVNDILNGYRSAIDYQAKNLDKFRKEFAIDNVMSNIIKNTSERPINEWEASYAEAVKDCQRAARRDFNNGLMLYRANREIAKLNGQIRQAKLTIDNVSSERDRYKANSEKLWDSSAYRIGRLAVKPISIMKKVFRRSG